MCLPIGGMSTLMLEPEVVINQIKREKHFLRKLCQNIGSCVYVLSISRPRVCCQLYSCEVSLSERIVHQCCKEVKFDSLPLNICYVRLNWHPHALTSGRRVTHPVRGGTLACCWVLRIAAFSVTDELPGAPASSSYPPRGTVCQELSLSRFTSLNHTTTLP